MKSYRIEADGLVIELPDKIDPAKFINRTLFDAMLFELASMGGDMSGGFDLVEIGDDDDEAEAH